MTLDNKYTTEHVDKKESVGVVIAVKGLNTEDVLYMLLQRGKVNPEETKPESFHGAYQTLHGGMEKEDGGNRLKALLREAHEELVPIIKKLKEEHPEWEEIIDIVSDKEKIKEFVKQKPQLIQTIDGPKKRVHTFGLVLENDTIFNLLKGHQAPSDTDFTRIRAVEPKEVNQISNLEPEHRNGVPNGEKRMFQDEKESIIKMNEIILN